MLLPLLAVLLPAVLCGNAAAGAPLTESAFDDSFHEESAAECAFRVHALIRDRLDQIAQVQLFTHGALLHIMDKTGPLHNAADRDHCVQYIVAISLLFGRLLISDFEDDFAADPCIDALRDKIILTEDPRFTEGFFDPKRRSSATGLEVRFRDGSTTARIDVEYPSGHPSRRDESATLFEQKFTSAVERFFQLRRPEKSFPCAPIRRGWKQPRSMRSCRRSW